MRPSARIFAGGTIIVTAGLLAPACLASAAASPGTVKSTTTALSTSSATVTWNSSVTFTAKVRAASGTPGGKVTFTDKSNGSVLDTATLHSGTATFTTAALAVGARTVTAHYQGNASYGASTSRAAAVSVTAGSSAATAYQADARHDGQASGGPNVAGLTKKWTVTLGQSTGAAVSYPLIAAGEVFVTVENATSYGTTLYALNASTGATKWSVGLGGLYSFSALTYDGRDLFALNYDGVLTAFTASTGHELWSVQMPGQTSFTAPPTAYDGVVYVTGAGVGGTLYAVSEAGGVVRWQRPVENGDKSSPAVNDSGAFVSFACQQDYRFKLGGTMAWHHQTACEGGGGSTAVLDGSSLYARGAAGDAPVILSTASGASTGSFASQTAPAFDASTMYTLQSGDLVAVDRSGSPDHWSFGDGSLVTAPLVAGKVIYVGSSNGTVYGVSATSGQQVWSGSAGTTILAPDEQNADILTGLGVAGGLLVVPAGDALTAFGG
jgi:outer membrane protein assembly factor BamB